MKISLFLSLSKEEFVFGKWLQNLLTLSDQDFKNCKKKNNSDRSGKTKDKIKLETLVQNDDFVDYIIGIITRKI